MARFQYRLIGLGLALALVTWVPLLILTAVASVERSGVFAAFVQSFATHARLLLAIPLFFIAEFTFDRRVEQVIGTMSRSRLVPDPERPRLDVAVDRARRWRDSRVLLAALMIITGLLIWSGVRADKVGVAWRQSSTGWTAAGWWYVLAGIPIFQFLMLRWFARLLIWAHVLWQISGLDLRLTATHPDLAGGLGGLGVAQVALAPLNFALSAVIVATFAEQIRSGGTDINRVVLPLVGAIAGCTFVLIAPLLLFSPMLAMEKQRGFIEYGNLASAYTHAFETRWIRGTVEMRDQLLGSADIQSLADLANAFDVVRSMRLLPIARTHVMFLLGAALLPAATLVLFVIPLDQLVIRSVQVLLGI